MIESKNIGNLRGANVRAPNGDKIGTIGQVYIDQVNGNPRWVSVRTGLFGMSESFVPLDECSWDGNDLDYPHTGALSTAN